MGAGELRQEHTNWPCILREPLGGRSGSECLRRRGERGERVALLRLGTMGRAECGRKRDGQAPSRMKRPEAKGKGAWKGKGA